MQIKSVIYQINVYIPPEREKELSLFLGGEDVYLKNILNVAKLKEKGEKMPEEAGLSEQDLRYEMVVLDKEVKDSLLEELIKFWPKLITTKEIEK